MRATYSSSTRGHESGFLRRESGRAGAAVAGGADLKLQRAQPSAFELRGKVVFYARLWIIAILAIGEKAAAQAALS
jgi:hypothetical protein